LGRGRRVLPTRTWEDEAGWRWSRMKEGPPPPPEGSERRKRVKFGQQPGAGPAAEMLSPCAISGEEGWDKDGSRSKE
jgi:hypothetical protein